MKATSECFLVDHVVYRLYDEAGALLYIGHTKNVEWRIRMHLRPVHRYASVGGAAEILERFHHYTFVVYETELESIEAERAAIFNEAPELNRQHNPKRWKFDGVGKKWLPVAAEAAA